MLSPLAELDCGDANLAALGWRSLDLWPHWIEELEEPVHFARRGSLLLAHAVDRASADRLLTRIAAQAPDRVPRALGGEALRMLEPSLAPGLLGWQLEGEGLVHPLEALRALAIVGSRLGVHWQWGRKVRDVAPGRLDEERFDHAIDVRGVGAKPALPVRGVRGEIFWLHAPGVALFHPLRLLHPRHRVYLVPRPGDIVVVGASEIESEDRSPVSLRSTLELLSAAHSVLPELAEARVVHSETNLRPALPDNLPLLQQEPGLTRVNGLFRHGWLVAPALVEQAMEGLA
jgi:glycine oxidase